MSMFTKDYWKTFSNYGNITNETLSESGPTAKKTNGDSYSEQDGNSVSVQNGNKNTLQVGVSNSLTYGFSFSTLAGASFSTTGGAALSNHVGLKWGMFVGPEMSINAAATVKVTKGGAYAFDTVTKWTTKAQDVKTAVKETQIATDLKRTIGQEISTQADFRQIVGGDADVTAVNYKVSSLEAITTDTLQLNLHSKLRARIQSQVAVVIGTTQLVLKTSGTATLNGSIIRLG